MKYRILLVAPSSKKAQSKIVISVSDGTVTTQPTPKSKEFDFEMPDDVPWKYRSMGVQGKTFDIQVVYTYVKRNKELRTIIYRPVPEEVK